MAGTAGEIRVWSAGCSSGEEPARHRAVAQLHRTYAALLDKRLGAPRCQEANPFVAAVPAVLGMQSASVTLLAGGTEDVVFASDRIGPRSRAADLHRLKRIGSAFVEVLLDESEHAGGSLLAGVDHRPIVHQAAGVVAHRSDCSPADVAQQVIDGTCSLDG